jgi:hypothetical protein
LCESRCPLMTQSGHGICLQRIIPSYTTVRSSYDLQAATQSVVQIPLAATEEIAP